MKDYDGIDEDTLGNLTDDQIQQLMEAGIAPEQIKLLQGRKKKEVGITSDGKMVGDRYIAANPLQMGLEAYQGYQDRKSNKALEDRQDQLMQSIPNARALYAGSMEDPNMQAKIAAALRQKTDDAINQDISLMGGRR